ncbi:MAG: TolB family protein, partial [Streptosporangiaceae bacterium]
MTPFHDLEAYIAIPRAAGLWVSPDGGRLVTTVSASAPDGKRFVTSLWEVDPTGEREPRRLTRSSSGEQTPAFLPDGSVLFVSRRPDPDAEGADEEADGKAAALWLLPAGGGEPRQVATRPGGVTSVAVARDAGTVVFSSPVTPGDAASDDARRRA